MTGLTSNPTIFDHAISHSASYDAEITRTGRRAASRARRCSSSWRSRICSARPTCSGRSTSAPPASTAGSRSRSRRCWPTTRARTVDGREGAARARPAGPTCSSRSPARTEGLPAIEEAIFAGVAVNVTLLFSREHYLAAADAYMRGLERRVAAGLEPGRALGRVAVRQPLGQGDDGQAARRTCATGWASRSPQADLQGVSRPAGVRSVAAPRKLRRAAAAAAVRQHRHQGPERVGHALHRRAGGAEHGQHDAGGDAAGISPITARSAACMPSRRRRRSETLLRRIAKAGVDLDGAGGASCRSEGAKAFVKSWNDLLEAIETKTQALA